MPPEVSKIRVVLLARIHGFERMLAQDPSEATKLSDFSNSSNAELVHEHGGQVLEAALGSLLAGFGDAKDAVKCSLAVQRGMREYNEGVSPRNRFRLRIGIHAPEHPWSSGGRHAEEYALLERIADAAPQDRICLTDKVIEACSRELTTVERGELRVPGAERAVRIHELFSLGRGPRREGKREADRGEMQSGSETRSREEASAFFRAVDRADGLPMDDLESRRPEGGAKFRVFLERLSRKGVLQRRVRDGVTEYSLAGARDLLNLKTLLERDGPHEEIHPPTGPYHVKPSVFVGAAGLIAGVGILLSLVTGGIAFPILVVVGFLIWTRSRGPRGDWGRSFRSWKGEDAEGGRAVEGGGAAASGPARAGGDPSQVLAEAGKLQGFIVEQLEAAGEPAAEVKARLLPLLGRFMARMEALDRHLRESERILGAMPMEALDKDLKNLQDSRLRTEEGRLKEELDASIRKIEKQRARYARLQKRREGIRLRLKAALSTLKRTYLETARMKGASAAQDFPSWEALREESRRLTQLLEDLEREQDPPD